MKVELVNLYETLSGWRRVNEMDVRVVENESLIISFAIIVASIIL